MPKKLQQLPPEPVDDEIHPLLDDDHPDHGTITKLQAALEDRIHDEEQGQPAVAEASARQLLGSIAPMYCLTFFAALDSTIVATLASEISNSFRSFTLLSWLASGYLVGSAATQPLSGKLSDIYGRRAGVVFACTFFAIGTAMCAVAPSAGVMIAGRIVAGAGGGCVNTISTFIASDLIPLRKRGLWQGFANLLYGTGMGLGGVFGGLVADRLGWRWAFYVQVPFIVLGGLVVVCTLDIPVRESETAKIKRVDFLGAVLLSTSLVLLLLGLNSGGNVVPWSHPLVLVSLPVSAATLLAFVYVEARVAPEPIIPMHLLAERTVLAALLANWLITMSIFATFYYGPVFFAVIAHLSPTQVGARLVPSAAGTALGSLLAGTAMRATGRYYALSSLAALLLLLASATLAITFRPGLPPWAPFPILAAQGLAYGVVLTATLLALLAAVPHAHQAVITSAQYAFRSTGSTIGVALAGAVFQNVLADGLWARFGDVPGAEDIIKRLRDDQDEVRRLGPRWRVGVEAAYADALRGVWGVVLVLAALGCVALLCMKEHRLHASLDRK